MTKATDDQLTPVDASKLDMIQRIATATRLAAERVAARSEEVRRYADERREHIRHNGRDTKTSFRL